MITISKVEPDPQESSKQAPRREEAPKAAEQTVNTRREETPNRTLTLEERWFEAKGQLAEALAQNRRLSQALREARERLSDLRSKVDKLTQPPNVYGVITAINDDGSVDVFSNGRKLRVSPHPELEGRLDLGQEVALNESSNVILARSSKSVGEVLDFKEMLPGGRVVVSTPAGEDRVLEIAGSLAENLPRPGDTLLVDSTANLAIEVLPTTQVPDLVLEEIPEVTYADIGGLDTQIEKITDALELPFLHPEIFAEHKLPYPKGILLYGPPGCGKTLIAKAVANSIASKMPSAEGKGEPRSYFLNVKGPELLNKYVGETERQIRLAFRQARERSEEGWPVIVFFDEMESLFRIRGSGISSDMEATVVPQLLAEIDGVETLRNVIIIGASNREDLIDPAVLRPGRLDVKIKIDRPDSEAATDIFARYLTGDLPIARSDIENIGGGETEKAVRGMIEQAVAELFSTEPRNEFLELTYQNGDQEVLYFRDWISGAMIENIVRRAKKLAVKRLISTGERGMTADDLIESIGQEFTELEELPNVGQPGNWAKLAGRKGERIISIRNLLSSAEDREETPPIERVRTGQYL